MYLRLTRESERGREEEKRYGDDEDEGASIMRNLIWGWGCNCDPSMHWRLRNRRAVLPDANLEARPFLRRQTPRSFLVGYSWPQTFNIPLLVYRRHPNITNDHLKFLLYVFEADKHRMKNRKWFTLLLINSWLRTTCYK